VLTVLVQCCCRATRILPEPGLLRLQTLCASYYCIGARAATPVRRRGRDPVVEVSTLHSRSSRLSDVCSRVCMDWGSPGPSVSRTHLAQALRHARTRRYHADPSTAICHREWLHSAARAECTSASAHPTVDTANAPTQWINHSIVCNSVSFSIHCPSSISTEQRISHRVHGDAVSQGDTARHHAGASSFMTQPTAHTPTYIAYRATVKPHKMAREIHSTHSCTRRAQSLRP